MLAEYVFLIFFLEQDWIGAIQIFIIITIIIIIIIIIIVIIIIIILRYYAWEAQDPEDDS